NTQILQSTPGIVALRRCHRATEAGNRRNARLSIHQLIDVYSPITNLPSVALGGSLYMDLGHLDTTSAISANSLAGSATGGQVTTHSHFTDGILRLGVNYQFH